MAHHSANPAGRTENGQEAPVDVLADRLTERLASGVGGTITWLNHYSAMVAMRAGVPLDRFDYLGVDGILLCRLLRLPAAARRTSADLFLPRLLQRAPHLRVALVGSSAEVLRRVADKVQGAYGHDVVLTRDGFSGRPDPAVLRQELVAARAQVVVLGLGTPLQDFYALSVHRPEMLVVTCGGWLDQFATEAYYPSWAYPLRLNWLVRLMREPRRLWRRYTSDAVRAVRLRASLVDYVTREGHRPLAAAIPAAPVPVPAGRAA